MHHLTIADQILFGLVAAYFAYRFWSGWGEGLIYGDGDDDVRADEHPTAFVLTALSVIMVIVICSIIALVRASVTWARSSRGCGKFNSRLWLTNRTGSAAP